MKQQKKYNPEEQKALCQQWKKSGLSQKAFCEKQGLSEATLYYWVNKYFPYPIKKREKSAFVPIVPIPVEFDKNNMAIELILPNKTVLKVVLPLARATLFIKELCHATAVIR